MVILSYTQPYTVINSHTQSYVVIHCHTQSYIVIHSHTQAYIVFHSHTQSYIVIHSHKQSYIVIHSHTQSYIVIHSHAYSYIVIHRHSQSYIVIHRFIEVLTHLKTELVALFMTPSVYPNGTDWSRSPPSAKNAKKCEKCRLSQILSAKTAIPLIQNFRCEKRQAKDSPLGSFRTFLAVFGHLQTTKLGVTLHPSCVITLQLGQS